MFTLVCFLYDIVPYQESTTLQLCRRAAALGDTIYVRSQMTDSRRHAESTTLQPCRTAAAVRDTIYVPLGGSFAELLVSEPVIMYHPTLPHVSAVQPTLSLQLVGSEGYAS